MKSTSNQTAAIQKELLAMKKKLEPLTKKNNRYAFLSSMMLGISIINLYDLLFLNRQAEERLLLLLFFALIGAFGMALFKEMRLRNKEIRKLTLSYIEERIRNSSSLSAEKKERYLTSIAATPMLALQLFKNFLLEEEKSRTR
ncbi:DUF5392 family protein [Bacillus massiliglaciei]|uniref:DUF5392 family protein n=1 Tax=Bacillus massiliglaciei TaxID=1816693 RepID=UPI000DA5F235|nr:DUF5392 family protein [Bacillus massiliglaciei]